MNEENKQNEETKNATSGNRPNGGLAAVKRRDRRTRWVLPVLAALGLDAAIVTEVASSHGSPRGGERGSGALAGVEANVPAASPEDRAREAARIRAARKAAMDSYQTAIASEYEAFKCGVDNRLAVFDSVRSGIPETVGKYDFKKCWSVMYALAKDRVAKMRGSGSQANFDKLMNADLRDGFYQPLQNARGEVLCLLNELQVRLQACRADLEQNLAKIPDWDRSLGEPPETLKAESLRVEEMLNALLSAQIGATVSAAFDAACLAGVTSTVRSLLAGAAIRLAGGTAAGAAVAMADSPAPGPADLVGLAIFGAGAAATAWEVRKAAKVIPERLSNTLNDVVDQQRAEVRSRTLDEGEKLYRAYACQTDGVSDADLGV